MIVTRGHRHDALVLNPGFDSHSSFSGNDRQRPKGAPIFEHFVEGKDRHA